jgi:hypothetical protein
LGVLLLVCAHWFVSAAVVCFACLQVERLPGFYKQRDNMFYPGKVNVWVQNGC